MYACEPHACLVPMEAEEDIRSAVTGVTNGCKLSHGYSKLNSSSLEEQSVL